MSALPREKAGVGSSVSNTVRQVGGALGVALLGTILTTAYRSRMDKPLSTVIPDAKARHDASGSIQATQGANLKLHGALRQFLPQANSAFIHAMHVTVIISAVVAVLGAGVVFAWLPGRAKGAPASGGPGAGPVADAVPERAAGTDAHSGAATEPAST
jgi:hypothetical protein